MLRRYVIIESPKMHRRDGASPAAAPSQARIREADLTEKNVKDLEKNSNIAGVGLIMPTRLIEPVNRSNIADGSSVWGVSAVGADQTALDGADVTVAVLDTGIDRTHSAFAGVDIEEMDFGGSGNGDRDGHGTHCAGTIFGKDVHGTRIGIAQNVKKALIAKVFPDGKGGDSLAVFKAMEWAANNGANIMSMSLGFDFPGMVADLERDGYPTELATSIGLEHFKDNLRMFDALMKVIEAGRAFGRGPMVVAAAGNESQRSRDPRFRISASLPSAASHVISVSAVRLAGNLFEIADFSNGRAKVCAPGENIASAAPGGGLATMSGTSMACPHVAGLAALWWQKVARSGLRPNADIVGQKMLSAAVTCSLARFDPDDAEVGFAVAPI